MPSELDLIEIAVATNPNPWDWRPSPLAWTNQLLERVNRWTPHSALAVDPTPIRRALAHAAESGDDWLFHPSLYALFSPVSELKGDLQLISWTAAHSSYFLGCITIPEPIWLWSSSGGEIISVGRHEIFDVARKVNENTLPVALDVWCESLAFPPAVDVGFTSDRFWCMVASQDETVTAQIEQDVLKFLRALQLVSIDVPASIPWLMSVTRVVIPLVPIEGSSFNSSSQPQLPGLVFSDMKNEAQIIEALVHESAHHHFHLAEAWGSFVIPNHRDRYSSPLRPEPRPLRGIFLAFHALAYICAFFREARSRGLVLASDDEIAQLRQKCDDAQSTLTTAASFLTNSGLDFFRRTQEVACHEL